MDWKPDAQLYLVASEAFDHMAVQVKRDCLLNNKLSEMPASWCTCSTRPLLSSSVLKETSAVPKERRLYSAPPEGWISDVGRENHNPQVNDPLDNGSSIGHFLLCGMKCCPVTVLRGCPELIPCEWRSHFNPRIDCINLYIAYNLYI